MVPKKNSSCLIHMTQFKNPLSASATLANLSMHGKFQLILTTHLAGATDVVRNLPSHLIGGDVLTGVE